MHQTTVDLLACPNCRGPLTLTASTGAVAGGGIVSDGSLACAGCGRRFPIALHLGGINFFTDRAAALREMARVARPGARVVVIDETEAVASGYRRFSHLVPGFIDLFTGPAGEAVKPPVDLLPPGMEDVSVESIWRDHGWCLSSRVPAA